MTTPIVIPEAQAEIDDALSASRQPGELLRAIRALFDRIGRFPEIGERLGRGYRVWSMTRYPYSIVYVVIPEGVRVVAFAHGKRRPGYWKDRT